MAASHGAGATAAPAAAAGSAGVASPPIPRNPMKTTSAWTFVTFQWVDAFMRKRGKIEVADLWDLYEHDSTTSLLSALDTEWQKEVPKPQPSLSRAFIRAFGARYALWSLLAFVKSAILLAQTQFLGLLLDELRSGTQRNAYLYALGLVLCGCGTLMLHHGYFFHAWRAGMRWRMAASALIFRKSLCLRMDALMSVSAGKIINMAASDVERAQKLCQYVVYVVAGPIEGAFIIWLLWREVSYAALGGLAVIVVCVGLQIYLSRVFGRLRHDTAAITDERVRVTNNIVTGIRVLKAYAWEGPFLSQVEGVRAREMAKITTTSWLRGVNEGLFTMIPTLVGGATFLIYYAMTVSGEANGLTPRKMFVSLSLYTLLQIDVFKFLQLGLESLAEVRISLQRLQEFLLLPDTSQMKLLTTDRATGERQAAATGRSAGVTSDCAPDSPFIDIQPVEDDDADDAKSSAQADSAVGAPSAIRITGMTCSWQSGGAKAGGSSRATLANVNLTVPRGSLCTIVGPVGSGKSSLLMAALKELRPTAGSVRVVGSVAYVSQSPWIVSGTIRENICFGLPYDEARYNVIVEACCLKPDLLIFPRGDAEVIGERGVNLSGGTRARVALARACYMDADVYLLDDPLSAVDARVGRALFMNVVMGLLATKTRVLVTHQLQYLRAADNIVVLHEGTPLHQGNFVELIAAVGGAATAGDAVATAAEEGGVDVSAGAASPSSPSRAKPPAGVGAALLEILREVSAAGEDDSDSDEEGGSAGSDGTTKTAPAVDAALAILRSVSNRSKGSKGSKRDRSGSSSSSAARHRVPSDGLVAGAAAAAGAYPHIHAPAGSDVKALDDTPVPSAVTPVGESSSASGPVTTWTVPAATAGALSTAEVTVAVGSKADAPSATTAAAAGGAPAVAEGDVIAGPPSSIIQAEKMAQGSVGARVYVQYFSAAGGCLKGLYLVLLLIAGASIMTYTSVWLAQWGNLPVADQRTRLYPSVYGGLVAATFLVSLWRATAYFVYSMQASTRIHNLAFARVLRVPISWFDANPAGRIVNRFSKDLSLMDEMLPATFFDFANSGLGSLAVVILVCVINPWVVICVPPLAILFAILRNYYMLTARSIKRLESVTRSPVYAVMSECLTGLPVIRAFRMQRLLLQRYIQASDDNLRAYFVFLGTSRWMGFRIDCLCFIMLAVVAFCAVAVRDAVSPALVGLSLSQVINLLGTLQWVVRQSSEVAQQMTSVERILEYANLPVEDVDIDDKPAAGKTAPPSSALVPVAGASRDSHEAVSVANIAGIDDSWPSAGAVTFDHVWLQYRPGLPHALRGVTFKVPAGCRVALVGRTGSGKSTIVAALMRLYPCRRGEGPLDAPDVPTGVYIDGVDTSRVRLSRLRRSISTIPQDPVLYAGTIRSNLDPFTRHSDEECWEALTRVQLEAFVREHGGLGYAVAENGSNCSVGQRQLLCLARALLRRSRIIVLDECSANVDADTDTAIQSAIRTAFSAATVITIAHRLMTIIDNDLVVVMDKGEAIEVGHPHVLLQRPEGPFARLVQETGPKMAALLAAEAAKGFAASSASSRAAQ